MTDAADSPRHRSLRHPPADAPPRVKAAFWLGTWFGCGWFPKAPGTAGTLGALPLYLLLRPEGAVGIVIGALLVTAVGVWAATLVGRTLGTEDPQIVCIDEVAGVLLGLAAAPPTWAGVTLAVVLFRILDVVKPWPARLFERRLPEGWGVMFDDVAAGIWTAALVLAARRLFGWL